MTAMTDPTRRREALTGMVRRNPLAATVIVHWGLFWAMNAADKVLNGTDLGLFTWHGKDRGAQFGPYFADMGLPTGLTGPVLHFAFLWEAVAGALFLAALARPHLLTAAFVVSAVTFTGFSAFDVVAGDRAELLEHGTYMALLLVGWKVAGRYGQFR